MTEEKMREEKILTKEEIEQERRKFVKEAIEARKRLSMGELVSEEEKKTLADTLGIAPQGKKDEKTEKPYGRII